MIEAEIYANFSSTDDLINTLSKIKKDHKINYITIIDTLSKTKVAPKYISSWRGDYRNPVVIIKETKDQVEIDDFILMLKEIDKGIYSGYKGGDFKLSTKDLIRFEYDTSEYEGILPLIIFVDDKLNECTLYIGRLKCHAGDFGEEI